MLGVNHFFGDTTHLSRWTQVKPELKTVDLVESDDEVALPGPRRSVIG